MCADALVVIEVGGIHRRAWAALEFNVFLHTHRKQSVYFIQESTHQPTQEPHVQPGAVGASRLVGRHQLEPKGGFISRRSGAYEVGDPVDWETIESLDLIAATVVVSKALVELRLAGDSCAARRSSYLEMSLSYR